MTCYGPRYFDTRGSRRAAFFTPFSHVSTFFSEPFNNLFSSPLSSSSSNLISSDLQSSKAVGHLLLLFLEVGHLG